MRQGRQKRNGTSQYNILCCRKGLTNADKEGNEDETVSKIAPIHQETQSEETVILDDKTCSKNKEKKKITVNVNGKRYAQDKINNEQNSVMQKKYSYNDVIN